MIGAENLHAGGAHKRYSVGPLGPDYSPETDVIVPLSTVVKAPGFADLFASMMRKPRTKLIDLAAEPRGATLQLEPLEAD